MIEEEAAAKAKAEELTQMIAEVQRAGHTNQQAVADLHTAIEELRQQIDTANRAAANRIDNSASNRDIDAYIEADDRIRGQESRAYFEREGGGHLRLFGHEIRTEDAEGQVFGLLDDPDPMSQEQADLQRAYEDLEFVQTILRKHKKLPDNADVSHLTPRLNSEVRRAAVRMGGEVARIFANTTNLGAEYMRVAASPTFDREVLAAMGEMGVIPRMSHPGGTLYLPYQTGFLQAFKEQVPTDDNTVDATLSSIGTRRNEVTTVDTVVAARLHRPGVEDSIIPILPALRGDMVRAFADADALSLFHGDTAGSQDDLTTWDPRGRIANKTANVHMLTRWDGARKLAIAAGADVNLAGAQTHAGLVSLIKTAGIEQYVDGRGSRLVVFISPEWFLEKGLHLEEFKTDSAVGQLAAVLTGNLGKNGNSVPMQVGTLIGSVPLALSYAITPDLNASGLYDNLTTNLTGAVLLDRYRWEYWVRKGIVVERDVEIMKNHINVVARKRSMLRTKVVGAGQTPAAFAYGLST